MRQYFLTIPTDYEEAAKLDGAGYFKTFWRVMLPLALPAIAALVDPPVPGHLERLLLAADHLRPGQPAALHRAARPRAVRLQLLDALASDPGRERDRDPADLASSSFFQRYFIAGARDRGGEGMIRPGEALRVALRDFYDNSGASCRSTPRSACSSSPSRSRPLWRARLWCSRCSPARSQPRLCTARSRSRATADLTLADWREGLQPPLEARPLPRHRRRVARRSPASLAVVSTAARTLSGRSPS